MIIGENVNFRIEVEDKAVLLVFDKKCDSAIVPWEDAFRLAEVMEQVIGDIRKDFKPTDFFTTYREQSQVKLTHHRGLVAILVEWTDRIRFTSLDAFFLVARALRQSAQDSQYELKGVIFQYDRKGILRKLHNLRTGGTQHVR